MMLAMISENHLDKGFFKEVNKQLFKHNNYIELNMNRKVSSLNLFYFLPIA